MISLQKSSSEENSPTRILLKLCEHILSKGGRQKIGEDLVARQFQYALKVVGSYFDPSVTSDEFQLAEQIKKKFARRKRESDAAIFSKLFQKLQSKTLLQNKWGAIYLLDSLSNLNSRGGSEQNAFYANGLPTLASTPLTNVLPIRGIPNASSVHGASGSSGIGSKASDSLSLSYDPTPNASSFVPRQEGSNSRLVDGRPPKPEKRLSAVAALAAQSLNIAKGVEPDAASKSIVPFPRRSGSLMLKAAAEDRVDGSKFEVTEQSLLRDILYVFQGIEGKMIRYEDENDGYRINPTIGVPFPIRDFIDKLNELGWLYRKVKKFLDARVGEKALGLVGQSFCAAVHKELAEYYRLLAVLEAQQNQLSGDGGMEGLTLRRLMVWTNDPLIRMKALATLVDSCKGKKGGALLSAIHSNTKVGDPYVRNLMKNILDVVSHPIKRILERWIYEGELQDSYHEFFVAADPAVRNERLWHEKYSLRKLMIPSFIPRNLATKILNIGKSINFLRVVCKDRGPIGDQALINSGKDSGFSQDLQEFTRSALEEIIDVVYKKTSKRLLEVLFNKYQFLDHLQDDCMSHSKVERHRPQCGRFCMQTELSHGAMRRYLLLGQGDFIRHLMDLLQSDLAKPANSLYMYNLTGVLEAAIRATNAQYDDPDILKRLDCRLFEISPGDCGWDVFSLDYHVDGPISTVFTPDCMLFYLRIFNFLWRAKRIEYCLTEIWKNQMTCNKLLRGIPEIEPLLHQSNCLEAEMVHFIHQMQYYITFEVLECCWEELLRNVKEATDLDHVIAAHETFLDQVMTRSLLDNESRYKAYNELLSSKPLLHETSLDLAKVLSGIKTGPHAKVIQEQGMLTQLRAIFDLIVQFQNTQEMMYNTALEELRARQRLEELIKSRTGKGAWGMTETDTEEEMKRTEEFQQKFIPGTRAQLRVLHHSYQDMLRQFLVMLKSHSDVSLQFLCFRLDFNEHYKSKEPKLRTPMPRHSQRYNLTSEMIPSLDLKL
eukprot:gene16861-8336_t